tara:strand:+ start:163 stop:546 length:384 start_codon:yes stop_codon:yes gene_type:complete
MIHHEYLLQKEVCKFLDLNYPKVLYMSDTIANIKLTIPQQARNKAIQKEGFKCPDLIIFEPKGIHNGLFIELKIKSPYKKNGELLKNKHLQDQQKTMDDLRRIGYLCVFAWNIENIKKLIISYLNLK